MNYLNSFLSKIDRKMVKGLEKSAHSFANKFIDSFSFNEHLGGLLFGHVQSGKTGQMMAIAAIAADRGFRFFILVTTDNIILQRQTLQRAKDYLGGGLNGFNVLDESDDQKFHSINHDLPTILILKKNYSVLKTWYNNIKNNPKFCDEPVFILDDEGDAASLNTKINKNQQSTINQRLGDIRNASPSSIYLHVTATPQSLLLQLNNSQWKPSFSYFIEPGKEYLGGDFFYGEGASCIRVTTDNEKDELIKTNITPEGFRRAIMIYLVTSAHLFMSGESKTNSLLIHPGIRIADHEIVKKKTGKFLEAIKRDLSMGASTLEYELHDCWEDLRTTKKNLVSFKKIMYFLKGKMLNINLATLNSKSESGITYNNGFNILVGGNSLGRGVTFPRLHTVYYCRSSKIPQADTCWQHSRIFGYDRDSDLCRVYIPMHLLKLFRELNDSNNVLFRALQEKGPNSINILTPVGARPTRLSVVKKSDLAIVAGGVNYFPSFPRSNNLKELDECLGQEDNEKVISLQEAIKILELTDVKSDDIWVRHSFSNCIKALEKSNKNISCYLIVRSNRSISKGTGTLLSPDDRNLGISYKTRLVLTMYRLNGEKIKGWNDKPLWVPNIKFPEGTCFYSQSG